MTIALTSATGKLGGAVLNAIRENNLIDPKELVVCVSRTSLSFAHYSHTPDILRPQLFTL